jgi:hypothetical protein
VAPAVILEVAALVLNLAMAQRVLVVAAEAAVLLYVLRHMAALAVGLMFLAKAPTALAVLAVVLAAVAAPMAL